MRSNGRFKSENSLSKRNVKLLNEIKYLGYKPFNESLFFYKNDRYIYINLFNILEKLFLPFLYILTENYYKIHIL